MLVEDPGEQFNLIEDEQITALEVLRRFRSLQLPYGLVDPSGRIDAAVDPELAKTLRALGYVR